jgi:hypothetical protein
VGTIFSLFCLPNDRTEGELGEFTRLAALSLRMKVGERIKTGLNRIFNKSGTNS